MPGTKKPTVEEILAAFKHPTPKPGKCRFMKRVDTLPENHRAAIYIVLETRDVSNMDILKHLMAETDLKVNLDMIQKHRREEGCVYCLYGGIDE